jgi:Flp pilus assembly protein TadG
MPRLGKALLADRRGVGAVEFALIAPALFMIIVGIAQLGTLFFAKAALQNVVAEAGRYATISPRPTDTQIQEKIRTARFGLNAQRLSAATIVAGKSDNADYLDITMSYQVPLNFIFVRIAPVTLRETRRVFVYPLPTL